MGFWVFGVLRFCGFGVWRFWGVWGFWGVFGILGAWGLGFRRFRVSGSGSRVLGFSHSSQAQVQKGTAGFRQGISYAAEDFETLRGVASQPPRRRGPECVACPGPTTSGQQSSSPRPRTACYSAGSRVRALRLLLGRFLEGFSPGSGFKFHLFPREPETWGLWPWLALPLRIMVESTTGNICP